MKWPADIFSSNPSASHAGARQRGFALVSAIFLLVVLALLGTAAVRIAGVGQQTANLALLAGRAYQAAQAGIDWGAYQALVNASCGSTTLGLAEVGLSGFNVQVDCSSTVHAEGAGMTTVYDLAVFASAGTYGEPDYVSRRIRATVTDGT